jgi:hypothetical protein
MKITYLAYILTEPSAQSESSILPNVETREFKTSPRQSKYEMDTFINKVKEGLKKEDKTKYKRCQIIMTPLSGIN